MGLTIFLYGFELIWQFYCVAMMIWIYWKKGWRFYCMDVRQFYHMDVWQFSYGCNLTIFLSPLHIYWTIFNVSLFLSQLTQEKVMHFFRKPWILAIGSNYETKSKYVMGGSKWVLVNLEEFCFLHWILITSHFYAS